MESEQTQGRIVFFSAAEASGDVHCGHLIAALKQADNTIHCVGVGGPKMAAAGCEVLIDTTKRAAMLNQAFTQVFFFLRVLCRIRKYFKHNQVSLVVVCDSPSFNFHVAKAAKKQNIPTLFYVAPQLWAWAAWRLEKLKNLATAGLASILPFEENWFGQRGLEVNFVGNPLLEGLDPEQIQAKDYSNFDSGRVHIALMPGSRSAEIDALWMPMQKIAIRLKHNFPQARFTAVAVDRHVKGRLQSEHLTGLRCEYSVDSVMETAEQADFALVASGSATLQVAAAGCPMAVMYQASKLCWKLIGKRLIKSKFLCLVNLLADRELVPEFMPYFDSIEPIYQRCAELIGDRNSLDQISSELAELTKSLATKKASQEVAVMITQRLVMARGA